MPLVRSGKIRALAVTSAQRTQAMPDLPTVAESGVTGYELRSWYGLIAPPGLPPAILGKLNQTVGSVMNAPEVRDRLAADGAEAAPANSPQQFRSLIAADIARWDHFLKSAKLKLD
jgi:tripartite-type tricarboxylate transporter receptor subunit TctC